MLILSIFLLWQMAARSAECLIIAKSPVLSGFKTYFQGALLRSALGVLEPNNGSMDLLSITIRVTGTVWLISKGSISLKARRHSFIVAVPVRQPVAW